MMDLQRYLQAIRKFWWVILIPALLGGLWGVASMARSVTQYEGSVEFFVQTSGETSLSAAAQGDQFAQRRVNSYVALLETDRLAQMVIEQSGLELTVGQVRSMIGASGDVNTVLLTATATSSDRDMALAVAEALSTELVTLVDEVENPDGDEASVSLEVVSGPTVDEVPAQPIRAIGLRVGIGLVFGLAAALILELRDTTIRSEDDLAEVGVQPVLGRIPVDRRANLAPLIIDDDAGSIRAEFLRQLRTNLQYVDAARPVRVVAVTSSVSDEGKSMTTANLALTLVAAGQRVAVVEADFRRPRVADYFGMERAAGLSDVLAGRLDLEDALQPWGPDGLEVLSSGGLPPNPAELVGSEAMVEVLAELRSMFDLVLIDTPPLLPVTDGAVMSATADGALLMVRYGRTRRHQVAGAARALEAVDARLLGAVLTMVPMNRGSGYTNYRYESTERSPRRVSRMGRERAARSGDERPRPDPVREVRAPRGA